MNEVSHRAVLSSLSSAGQGDMAWTFLRVNFTSYCLFGFSAAEENCGDIATSLF